MIENIPVDILPSNIDGLIINIIKIFPLVLINNDQSPLIIIDLL